VSGARTLIEGWILDVDVLSQAAGRRDAIWNVGFFYLLFYQKEKEKEFK
tara:strand:- start:51 stop:197 length:147 start_codon:yes stop_codon:yes gene_type:complete